MTDIAASGRGSLRRVDVTSAKAQARIRARYRKEKRFKLYGLGALLLTTVGYPPSGSISWCSTSGSIATPSPLAERWMLPPFAVPITIR